MVLLQCIVQTQSTRPNKASHYNHCISMEDSLVPRPPGNEARRDIAWCLGTRQGGI